MTEKPFRVRGEDYKSAVEATPFVCSHCGRPVKARMYRAHRGKGDSGWRVDHVFVFPVLRNESSNRSLRARAAEEIDRFVSSHPSGWRPVYTEAV